RRAGSGKRASGSNLRDSDQADGFYADGFQSVEPQRGQAFQWGSPIAPQPPQRTDLTTAISGLAPRESSFQTMIAPMAKTAIVSRNQPTATHKRAATRVPQIACHCFRL